LYLGLASQKAVGALSFKEGIDIIGKGMSTTHFLRDAMTYNKLYRPFVLIAEVDGRQELNHA
jgi:hypothetical protein